MPQDDWLGCVPLPWRQAGLGEDVERVGQGEMQTQARSSRWGSMALGTSVPPHGPWPALEPRLAGPSQVFTAAALVHGASRASKTSVSEDDRGEA